MTTIQKPTREPLAKQVDPTSVSPEIHDLATRCATMLGYKVIKGIVGKPKTLREALMELNIAPFSKRSVELYKGRVLKKAEAKLKKEKSEMEARWRMMNISGYDKPIPERVLATALRIKESLPEARFSIEELTIGAPDPFLVVSFKDERQYVDVWDEPEFENKILRGAYIHKESDFDEDSDE